MHIGVTTVALYDTLGEEALKFIVNQTELITFACSGEQVEKISA
jgi:long-subunit acyl-CoA synthetase (AMP-forming)